MQMVESSPEQAVARSAGRHVPAPRRPDAAGGSDPAPAAARVVHGRRRPAICTQQLTGRRCTLEPAGAAAAGAAGRARPPPATPRRRRAADLELFNGIGGFARRRPRVRDRRVDPRRRRLPPAPWSNVVANPTFGFVATESGAGLHLVGQQPRQPADALAQRSGQRTTPGEAMFLRDEETGRFWSATPLPAGHGGRTSSATAQGYQRSSTRAHGCSSTLRAVRAARRPGQGVPPHAAQQSGAARGACRSTLYVEWVLGENRDAHRSCTSSPAGTPATGALLARNAFRQDFADARRLPRSAIRAQRAQR